jgi:hypothetical protein
MWAHHPHASAMWAWARHPIDRPPPRGNGLKCENEPKFENGMKFKNSQNLKIHQILKIV